MIVKLWNVLCSFLLILILLNVSLTDIRYYRIPKHSYLLLLIIGLVDALSIQKPWIDCMIGFLSVSFGLILIYILTKGKAIGGGDIKLMAFTGILLGWKRNILAFFTACVLVTAHFLLNKKHFRKSGTFAFGPYLSMGILLSWFFGFEILNAYSQWPGII